MKSILIPVTKSLLFRAYRLASGTTTITYTYAEEKTREIEKKGSVVVNYQTEDGTELKAPYTDTPETVVEVVTEHYYVNADGEEVVVEDKTVRTPKNVAYNTKETKLKTSKTDRCTRKCLLPKRSKHNNIC